MNKRKIQLSVILGVLAVAAIVSFQYLWFRETFNEEKRKFNQSVHIALLEVVKLLVSDNQSQFPQANPIEKISDDFYLVKINDEINAEILEFYLKNEFEKRNIRYDFEYAIYDCRNDEMVYGNYVTLGDRRKEQVQKAYFPKIEDLVYYFAVRFPDQPVFFSKPTKNWTIITFISLLVLLIYIYSIFIILRQNRYYELQKDFINNMTHEFKTPLSSIMIASEYISEQNEIKSNPRLTNYSEAITKQSRRLNNHIERILSLAKSERKSFNLQLQKLDLVSTLTIIIDTYLVQFNQKIDLRFNCPENVVFILADENHFTNAVNNLIDNAIKYSNTPAKIEVSVDCDPKKVLLKIKDHGHGMDKKELKRIFNKFYRIPMPNSQQVGGFGLGLYYVKTICDQHKWLLEIDSEVRKGTEVQIIMPRQ